MVVLSSILATSIVPVVWYTVQYTHITEVQKGFGGPRSYVKEDTGWITSSISMLML